MSSTQATGKQFLNLYRDFLRTSNNFTNYNFRNYFLRKAKRDFRNYRDASLTSNATPQKDVYQKLLDELCVLKRQTIVSQLYTFDKLVVEPLNPRGGRT